MQRHGALRARLAPAPQSGRRFWQATVVKTLHVCEGNPFWQGVGTRAIHCYDMWYMFILQKLRLQLDGRALHFDSCDHQDDMISSSFESLIESKQSVPPVSILELLRVFENCLASRAVWLARN